jgi:hypothetical protein
MLYAYCEGRLMTARFNRKDFLDALFFNYCRDKGGFILVKIADRHMAKTATRYFPNPDTLAREHYMDDQNVLFGVCPRDKMKPGKEFVSHLTAVWAGLDIGPDGYSGKEKHFASDKQAIMAMRSFPLEPSIVVQSGRGVHLYWLLSEITPVSDAASVEAVLRRVNEFFQCSSEVSLEACMRLPETWNPKHPSHPMECRIHHFDTSVRYHFHEFENLDLRVIIPSKKTPRLVPPPPPPAQVRSRITVIPDAEEPADIAPSIIDAMDASEIVAAISGPPSPAQVCPEPLPDDEDQGPSSARADDSVDDVLDRFLDKFSDRILDRLADRVVEKLLQRLPLPQSRRQ